MLNISEYAYLTNTDLQAFIVCETPGTDMHFSLAFFNSGKSVYLALGSTGDTT